MYVLHSEFEGRLRVRSVEAPGLRLVSFVQAPAAPSLRAAYQQPNAETPIAPFAPRSACRSHTLTFDLDGRV